MRAPRRLGVGAVMVALAGAVVFAHSAAASDHMGEAMATCIAVVDAAVLGLVVLSGRPAFECFRSAGIAGSSTRLKRQAARRPTEPPWPRGSPFALQVLLL